MNFARGCERSAQRPHAESSLFHYSPVRKPHASWRRSSLVDAANRFTARFDRIRAHASIATPRCVTAVEREPSSDRTVPNAEVCPAHAQQRARARRGTGGMSRSRQPAARSQVQRRERFTVYNNEYIFIFNAKRRMRFVHKKLSARSEILHISAIDLVRKADFGSRRSHSSDGKSDLGEFNKPAILRHYLHDLTRPLVRRAAGQSGQPCRKVNRSLPSPCIFGLAASQHWNFCTAEFKLYSFQR